MTRALVLAAVAAALFGSLPAAVRSEQFLRAGAVEIHYNAFRSDAIPAEVATALEITRSEQRGLVNVSVVHPGTAGQPRGGDAEVTGSVANLAGQRQPLVFRAVREANAQSYLAEFPIAGEDVYRFELEVRPAGATDPLAIRFEQPLVGR